MIPITTRMVERRKLPLKLKAVIMMPLNVEPRIEPKYSMPWKIPIAPPLRSIGKRFTMNVIDTAKNRGAPRP